MTDQWLPRATRVIQVFALVGDDDTDADDPDVVLVVESESGEHIHLRLSGLAAAELSNVLAAHLQLDHSTVPWARPPGKVQ